MLYRNLKTGKIFYDVSQSPDTISDGNSFFSAAECEFMTEEKFETDLAERDAKLLSIGPSQMRYFCEPYFFIVPLSETKKQFFYSSMKAIKLITWMQK